MTVKATPASKIDQSAYYRLRVSKPFVFEDAEFAPMCAIEISGDMLSRLLADDACKAKVKDFDKKD